MVVSVSGMNTPVMTLPAAVAGYASPQPTATRVTTPNRAAPARVGTFVTCAPRSAATTQRPRSAGRLALTPPSSSSLPPAAAEAQTLPVLTVGVIEVPHRFGDVAAQLALVDAALSALVAEGPVDLAVLPECALTGYVSDRGGFDLSPFAEPLDGPTTDALRDLARRHGLALCAPLVERDDRGRCFNTTQVLAPDGARLAHYRKRHPWWPERWAARGDIGTPTFSLAGATITVAVCYDIHFVSRESAHALDSADLLLFPSAWCDASPVDQRDEMLPALARRHRVAVANANWGRGSRAVKGQGRSRVVDVDGSVAAECAPTLARGVQTLRWTYGGPPRP